VRPIFALLLCFTAAPLLAVDVRDQMPPVAGAIYLAGERIAFDAREQPRFTQQQIRGTDEATRIGLVRWASTAEGRKLIDYFTRGRFSIAVVEDLTDAGAGNAPQPGLATLVAANDPAVVKTYVMFLNPASFNLPAGMKPMAGQPATAADMMAAAWAAEMLHVYFYTRGIVLPHHQRHDFQQQWQTIAAELGFPGLEHDDVAEEQGRSLRRALIGRYPSQ
jgi:hypothetical protein